MDPRDQRLRASVLLQWDQTRILIDAGPDFRQQALRSGIMGLEEVWLTHGHADHTNGIDDLRVFCFGGRVLPVRGSATTLQEATTRFRYAFRSEPDPSGVSHPLLLPKPLPESFEVSGRKVIPLPVHHGPFSVTGFRIGELVYLTDVSEIPASTFDLMEGTRILILSALREEPHPTHLTFDQAIAIGQKIGAEQVWFTHFAHGLTHSQMEARFPPSIRPAYDGLVVEFT